jgi:hypothetical protein
MGTVLCRTTFSTPDHIPRHSLVTTCTHLAPETGSGGCHVPVAQPLRIRVPAARLSKQVRPAYSLPYHGPLWKGQTAGSGGCKTGNPT